MSSKREAARNALIEWSKKTTPEEFVEQHKGIDFPATDKTIGVEIMKKNEGWDFSPVK